MLNSDDVFLRDKQKDYLMLNSDDVFLRVKQIIGDLKASPPIPPIIPVGKSTWWQGCREGKFPKPIKIGTRTTVWRKSEVIALLSGAEK